MGKYVVKNGENIFDIAMKLYGSIEGLFDLMTSNTDAVSQTGLSLKDALRPGTVLQYTDDFAINQAIADKISDDIINMRNGDHTYFYCDINGYAAYFARKNNLAIIRKAFSEWPSVKHYSQGLSSEQDAEQFLQYVNDRCMLITDVSKSNIPALESGDYTAILDISLPERFDIPKMVIHQSGPLSSVAYIQKEHSVIIIDWGDNTVPEICTESNVSIESEHCYEDSGTHIIKIYGSFEFSMLDLSAVNGAYYPLSEIRVDGEFNSNLSIPSINKLIAHEQDN